MDLERQRLSTTFEFMLENGFSNPRSGKSWSVDSFLEVSGFGRATFFRLIKDREVRKNTVERAADCLLQELELNDPKRQVWKTHMLDLWRDSRTDAARDDKYALREKKVKENLARKRGFSSAEAIRSARRLESLLDETLDQIPADWDAIDITALRADLAKGNLRSASARLQIEGLSRSSRTKQSIVETLRGEIELERLNLGIALTLFKNAADLRPTRQALSRAGEVAWMIGHFDKAAALEEDCLEMTIKDFGTDHELTAQAHNNLGITLAATGNFSDAITNYKDALRIRHPKQGGPIEDYARCLNNLCAALVRSGREKEAQHFCIEVLDIRQTLVSAASAPEDIRNASIDLSCTFHVHGWLLQSLDRPDDAEAEHREALALRQLHCEDNLHLMSQSLFEVGRSVLINPRTKSCDALQEAERQISNSMSIYETIVGNYNGEYALRKCFLEWCLVLQGKSSTSAVLVCEAALRDLMLWYDKSHPDYLDGQDVKKEIEKLSL